MYQAENPHWSNIVHDDPNREMWASNLLVSHMGGIALTDPQEWKSANYMVGSTDTDVQFVRVETLSCSGQTSFSFRLEICRFGDTDEEELAIVSTVTASLMGMHEVGVDLSDLQFGGLNMAPAKELEPSRPEEQLKNIRDRQFEFRDQMFAYDQFHRALAFYDSFDELLHAYDG